MRKARLSFQILLRISVIIFLICTVLTMVSVTLFSSVLIDQVKGSITKSRDDGVKLIEMAISSYIKKRLRL